MSFMSSATYLVFVVPGLVVAVIEFFLTLLS